MRHYPRLLPFAILTLSIGLFGCTKKEHGQCGEPHENVTWFWMKDTGPWGTAYKCLHCDNDYVPQSPDDSPCFYTYPDTGWNEPGLCQANDCSDDPATNDPVKLNHGAWKHVGPLLHDLLPPGQSESTEESILLPASLPIEAAVDETAADTVPSDPEPVGYE